MVQRRRSGGHGRLAPSRAADTSGSRAPGDRSRAAPPRAIEYRGANQSCRAVCPAGARQPRRLVQTRRSSLSPWGAERPRRHLSARRCGLRPLLGTGLNLRAHDPASQRNRRRPGGYAGRPPRTRAAASSRLRVSQCTRPALARGRVSGDTAGIRKALAGDSILEYGPYYVVFYALDLPLDLRGTAEIYPRAHARSATAEERATLEETWSRYELMRGRPHAAPRLSSASESYRLYMAVVDGLFADGDSAKVRTAAAELEPQLGRPFVAGDGDQLAVRYAVGQYGLTTGRLDIVRRAIRDLQAARPDSGRAWQVNGPRRYALLLEAQLAARQRQATAPIATTWRCAVGRAGAAAGGSSGAR